MWWPFRRKSAAPTRISPLEALRRIREVPRANTPEGYVARARALAEIAEAEGSPEFARQFREEADGLERLIKEEQVRRSGRDPRIRYVV